MAIEWGLLDQNAFQRGYQQTKGVFDDIEAKRKQAAIDNALRQYALNPQDPKALNALAVAAPATAIPLMKDQRDALQAKHEKDAKFIGGLAASAKTPEAFDAAVDQVVQMGYPEAAQFKGKFSPQLRAALMAAGGVKDETTSNDVVVIDGVAFDKNTRQPVFESPYPKIVSGPGGIYEQPRVGYGRQGPAVVPQGKAIAGPEIAPGWELLDEPTGEGTPDEGGPTRRASGGFP